MDRAETDAGPGPTMATLPPLDEETARQWLIAELRPISDADPDVLARYVLALLRNDKTLPQLRSLCVEQLEDFLADRTGGFVTRLFDALEGDLLRATERTDDASAANGADGEEDDDEAQNLGMLGEGGGSASEDDEEQHHRRRARGGARSPEQDEAPAKHAGARPDEDPPSRKRRRGDAAPHRGPGRPAPGPRGFPQPPVLLPGGGVPMMGHHMAPPQALYPLREMQQGRMVVPPPGAWPPPFAPPPGRMLVPQRMGVPMMPMMPAPVLQPVMPRGMAPVLMPRGGGGGPGNTAPHPSATSAHGAASRPTTGKDAPVGVTRSSQPISTLLVSGIPKHVQLPQLRDHFIHFGAVKQVRVTPEVGQRAGKEYMSALIRFGSHDEAQRAFGSPMPVLNNRFIQVRWAREDLEIPSPGPRDEAEDDASAAAPSEPPQPKSAPASAAAAAKTKREISMQLHEKRKVLAEQREQLFRRQLEQQIALRDKMAASAAVSEAAMEAVHGKIAELEALLQPRGEVNEKPAAHVATGQRRPLKLDNRTRTVKVSELPTQTEAAAVRALFEAFGEITDVSVSDGEKGDGRHALVVFAQRRAAEVAISRKQTLDGAPLQLEWCSPPTPPASQPPHHPSSLTPTEGQEPPAEPNGQPEGEAAAESR